jgi:hypothetical protein
MKTPSMRAFGQRITPPLPAVADQEKNPVVDGRQPADEKHRKTTPPAYPP